MDMDDDMPRATGPDPTSNAPMETAEAMAAVPRGGDADNDYIDMDGTTCTDSSTGVDDGANTLDTQNSLQNASYISVASNSSGETVQNDALNDGISVYAPTEIGGSEEDLYGVRTVRRAPKWDALQSLPWFHPGVTRHVAQALLMQNGSTGSFLLRMLDNGEMCISARSLDSVKHFKLHFTAAGCTFGKKLFPSPKELIDHFDRCPTLGGASGILTTLSYPYPRDVEEFASYEPVRVHTEWGSASLERADSMPSRLSTSSKEGYLTKLGRIHKNWRPRWFVLYKDTLKYFKERGDEDPIRSISLKHCSGAERDDSTAKHHCFSLQTPGRKFFMFASDDQEANEWVSLLNWKLKTLGKQMNDDSFDQMDSNLGIQEAAL